MKIKAAIDKIEENIALLLIRKDENERIYFPEKYLPEDAQEGSIVNIEITVDHQKTQETKKRVSSLIDQLKKKTGGN